MKKLAALSALALTLAVGGIFVGSGKSPAPAGESAGETSLLAPPPQTPAPSRAPAATPAPADPIAAIQKTKSCLYSDDCDFPQTDPHSYTFAVGKKLAAQVQELRVLYGDDPSRHGELGALAREMVLVDDGFVQEEAIKVFSLLPASRENVVAMIEGLETAHSPLLIEQAMKEWERYVGSPEEALIQEFLAEFIARGGQFSSEKASELILGFLNERTERTFREALAGMIPESTQARNLRTALQEYERMRSGG